MTSNGRVLRSATPSVVRPLEPQDQIPSPCYFIPLSCHPLLESIDIIAPGSKLPGLSSQSLSLLRQKQTRLAKNAASMVSALPTCQHHLQSLKATLIFAQYEAGTAVCIGSAGWALTCSHCFGDSEEEYRSADKRRWLLFYTGLAVQVECRVWDLKRDLTLLKIIAVESDGGHEGQFPTFPSVTVASRAPAKNTPIICIGQPGRDDLESPSDRRTKYNLVEISEGRYRGMMPGVDPQDNSKIGSFMHDAWTYWGHSGAPLLRQDDGTLVGLHSSWDDQTAMRHGIPLVAIQQFLQQQQHLIAGGSLSSTSFTATDMVGTKNQNAESKTATETVESNIKSSRSKTRHSVTVIDDD